MNRLLALVLLILASGIVAISLHHTTGAYPMGPTCNAAKVQLTIAEDMYLRVYALANYTGGLMVVNASLSQSFKLISSANTTLSAGNCTASLKYSTEALAIEAYAWARLMNYTHPFNKTCIGLLTLAEAKVLALRELGYRLGNSTIVNEADELAVELNKAYTSSNCSLIAKVYVEASGYLKAAAKEAHRRLGEELYAKLTNATLLALNGKIPLTVLKTVKGYVNSTYGKYIIKAVEKGVEKYSIGINQTIYLMLSSGNLTGIITVAHEYSLNLQSLEREFNISVVRVRAIEGNLTALERSINETLVLLNMSNIGVQAFGEFIREVYPMYINGSFSRFVNMSIANESYYMAKFIKLEENLTSIYSMIHSRLGLPPQLNSTLTQPVMIHGLIRPLAIYWNFTAANYTQAMRVYWPVCRWAYGNVTYLLRALLAYPRPLNATTFMYIMVYLYLMRVNCPMALRAMNNAYWAMLMLEKYTNSTTAYRG